MMPEEEEDDNDGITIKVTKTQSSPFVVMFYGTRVPILVTKTVLSICGIVYGTRAPIKVTRT